MIRAQVLKVRVRPRARDKMKKIGVNIDKSNHRFGGKEFKRDMCAHFQTTILSPRPGPPDLSSLVSQRFSDALAGWCSLLAGHIL